MSIAQILASAWRRRLSFGITFLTAVLVIVAVSLTLPKTYEATTTLTLGSTIDTTQAEQLVRTYATLAANPNVAEQVGAQLPTRHTRQEVLERMSFAPVERTQLLLISAEGSSPEEAKTLADVYAAVFSRRIGERVEQGTAPIEIKVAEPASLPTNPIRPSPPLYIGLGTLLALVLALAVASARERLDTRIRGGPDEDMLLGQPILTRVPGRRRLAGRGAPEPAEGFGLLKMNLDGLREGAVDVVVVTSPRGRQGASAVAAGLALECLSAGQPLVLVEADLVGQELENAVVPSEKRARTGLAEYLAGAASEDDVLVEDPSHPGLTMLWAGSATANAAVLLTSPRFATLVDQLRRGYGRVIIHGPPLLTGAAAAVIASRADGTLLVLAESRTRREDAHSALIRLAHASARVLGIALTNTAVPAAAGFYYRQASGEQPEGAASMLARRAR